MTAYNKINTLPFVSHSYFPKGFTPIIPDYLHIPNMFSLKLIDFQIN